MSQQLGIIVMIEVESAIKANSLQGNVYLFDNMKLQGSEGEGTGKFISAINGTHFCDGSQANEQVLNWLPYGLGSLPPSIPKTYLSDRAKSSDLQALGELRGLIDKFEQTDKAKTHEDMLKELKKIAKTAGVATKKTHKTNSRHGGNKLMDVTGELVGEPSEKMSELSAINPIITDITGEAVDKNIIYPAAYGSPDMVTDGWYWSASVDSSKPGVYAYTMQIQLHKLDWVENEYTWVPLELTYDAYIRISNDLKINGFTGAGIGLLPIP